jgi:hypothetical protein
MTAVRLWHDYDEDSIALMPGLFIGSARLDRDRSATAAELFDRGVRKVSLDDTVDEDAPDTTATVHALTLVRDLTSLGVVVDWRLRISARSGAWQMLNHLHPPTRLTVGDVEDDVAARAAWEEAHFLGRCLFRVGPGFLQIRDRRWGGLRRVTIAEPEYREAVMALLDGAPAETIAPHVMSGLSKARLVRQAGGRAWWLPYRVRRWPHSSVIV